MKRRAAPPAGSNVPMIPGKLGCSQEYPINPWEGFKCVRGMSHLVTTQEAWCGASRFHLSNVSFWLRCFATWVCLTESNCCAGPDSRKCWKHFMCRPQ